MLLNVTQMCKWKNHYTASVWNEAPSEISWNSLYIDNDGDNKQNEEF